MKLVRVGGKTLEEIKKRMEHDPAYEHIDFKSESAMSRRIAEDYANRNLISRKELELETARQSELIRILTQMVHENGHKNNKKSGLSEHDLDRPVPGSPGSP